MSTIRKTAWVWGLGVALAVGCSANRTVENVAINANPSDNPSTEITKLEEELADAQKAQAPTLAPTWYESSQRSLDKARELRDKGGDYREIYRHAAEGRVQAQRAKEYAAVSQRNLTDVVAARDDAYASFDKAKAAGATDLKDLSDEIQGVDKRMMKLTKAVEDDNLKGAQAHKQDVIKRYHELQSKSVEKEKLDTARRVLEQAKNEGASKYAGKSLAYSEELMKAAEKFIQNAPEATKQIDEKRDEAQFYAQRTLELTRQGKLFSDKKPEEISLWVEENIRSVGTELDAADQRNRPLEAQFDGLKQAARGVTGKATADNASETNRLKSELKMSKAQMEKIKAVSKNFSPQEAEVITKEGKLVLRVRGLSFPSGKATLDSSNFPLLGKVAESIKLFPEATIVVEGHTDSTGDKAVNARLSQERADAVKNYFVSSNTLDEDKVSAVGKGYASPITSNKTKEGRAMNRRIDVVIVSSASGPTVGE